jgi:hypothetical protein
LEEEIERIKTTIDPVEAAEFLDISSKWKALLAAEVKLEEKGRRVSSGAQEDMQETEAN